MTRALTCLFLAFFSLPLAAQNGDTPGQAAAAATASALTTGHGVYSAEQAERGRAVFEMSCASCHAPSDYAGEQFRMNWFGRRVSDLFRTLKTTMPEDNIGGLSDEDYTRVITYILKLNGFPAGKDSLPSDSTLMRGIRIGPSPAASGGSTKTPGR